MQRFVRRSLLVQLLSVYLLFVIVVLLGGLEVNFVVEQRLSADVQAADQALAQELASETSLHLLDTENALATLGNLAKAETPAAMVNIFQAWKSARSDVDQVYWLDPVGDLLVSWPPSKVAVGAEFSPPTVVQQALMAKGPAFEVGIAAETTSDPGVIIAQSVRASRGTVVGIIAASFSLAELSVPLSKVVQSQQQQGRRLMLSIIDDQGRLIATPGHQRILQTVLDEFKTTLLAAVGHEVRTPLAAIKGYASTLLQEDVVWSPADQRHFLETISSEADRLARLVSNLLDLSRQEAGLLLLNRRPTRVQDLVMETIKRLSHPGVTIAMHVPDDLPPVNLDSTRIEVVLHNLVANALTYGASEVCIIAEKRDDTIIVSVSDNGPGIDPDELPHIFERFYRARHGRQQHAGGTGLGLTICKAFIEAHGGTIWAESSGQGTTISFSLPLISPPTAALATDMRAKKLSKEDGRLV